MKQMNWYLKIEFFLVLLLLSGCATTLHQGKPFKKASPPSNNKSLVYVFRVCTPPFYVDVDLYFNDKKMMVLPNKGYKEFYVEPGTYKLTLDWPALSGAQDIDKEFTFDGGKTYYVGIVSTNCNNLKTLARLEHWFGEWPEEKGLKALNICTLVNSSETKNIK